jgi:hypothetical protein
MDEIALSFEGFAKVPRLARDCVVTEKIDGTNAQILITEDQQLWPGSRTKFVTPMDDNYGFARWVHSHRDELMEGLGPGRHFGEWWGQGIQRNYGLKEKRFSLFNAGRWVDRHTLPADMAGCSLGDKQLFAPECCHVVPILRYGIFTTDLVEQSLSHLHTYGSLASPGFMNPEGVVIFHVASGYLFKKTFKGDGGKWSENK